MMNYSHDHRELTDEELHTTLHGAGEDLLAHLRATGDPTRGFMALMTQTTAPHPESETLGSQAACVITARARTEGFLGTMKRAILVMPAYAHLAAVQDQAKAIERARKQIAALIDTIYARSAEDAHTLAGTLGQALEHIYGPAHDLAAELAAANALEHVYGPAHDLAAELTRAHGLAAALALDLDRAGALADTEALEAALAEARYLAGTLAQALALTRVLIRDFADALDRAFTRALDRALDRALTDVVDPGLTDAFDRAIDRVHRLDRYLRVAAMLLPDAGALRICGLDLDLVPALGPDWNPLTDDLKAVERSVRRLLSALMRVQADASSADLSRLELGMGDLGALDGVTWTEQTRWPVALYEIIERSSQRIADGVYRISFGTDRDGADISTRR